MQSSILEEFNICVQGVLPYCVQWCYEPANKEESLGAWFWIWLRELNFRWLSETNFDISRDYQRIRSDYQANYRNMET